MYELMGQKAIFARKISRALRELNSHDIACLTYVDAVNAKAETRKAGTSLNSTIRTSQL